MALMFSKAWREQRTRNRNEAETLVAQYGDRAPEIVANRLDSSTKNSRDYRHWKRVQSQVISIHTEG